METQKPEEQLPSAHQEAPSVRVERLTLSGERVFAGEPVVATILLRNPAGTSSLYNLSLSVNGEPHTTRDIELARGEVKEINITVIRVEQGRHTVQTGNASALFEVIHAGLVVTSLNVTPAQVAPLESVKISATVENPNAVETTGNIRFFIKEDIYDRDATVEPYGVQTLSFHVEREEPTSYYVIAGNHSQHFIVATGDERGATASRRERVGPQKPGI